MIPEPFTAVATSIGLLSSAFALLITSVRTVHGTFGDAKDCRVRLQVLGDKFKGIEEELGSIEEQWKLGQSYGAKTFECIFGRETYSQAERCAWSVQVSLEAVSHVFQKGYDVSLWRSRVGSLPQTTSGVLQQEDISIWKRWEKQAFAYVSGKRQEVATLNGSVASRFAFAMIGRADLDTKVDYLEQATKNLKDLLKRHFERLPDICDKPSKPEYTFFASIARLHRSNEEFARHVSGVLAIASTKGKRCGIVLDLDKRTMAFLHPVTSPIELLVTMRPFADFKIAWPQRAGFLEDLEGRISQYENAQHADFPSPADPVNDSSSLHHNYHKMHGWQDDDIAVYQKCSEDERYRTILSLLATTNLLWNTSWMAKLCCTCNIEPPPIFETDPSVILWPDCACPQHHRPHAHFPTLENNEFSNGDKLVRLAFTICEVALCSPVETQTVYGQKVYSYRRKGHLPTMARPNDWSIECSAQTLIEDAQDSLKGMGNAGQSLSVLLLSQLSQRSRVTYMDACGRMKKDLEGLAQFYDSYCQHRQKQSDRRWFKSLQRRHDNIVRFSASPRSAVPGALLDGSRTGPAGLPLRSRGRKPVSRANGWVASQSSSTIGEFRTVVTACSMTNRDDAGGITGSIGPSIGS